MMGFHPARSGSLKSFYDYQIEGEYIMTDGNPIQLLDMDKPRTLKFTLQNMAKAERLIAQREGMRFVKLNEVLQPFGHTAERLSIILLFGLMHEDPNLTEEKVSEIYETYVSKFQATEIEGAYSNAWKAIEKAVTVAFGPLQPVVKPLEPEIEKSSPGKRLSKGESKS
jgi:hypothetical protein